MSLPPRTRHPCTSVPSPPLLQGTPNHVATRASDLQAQSRVPVMPSHACRVQSRCLLRSSGYGQTHPSPDRDHTRTVTVTARPRRCGYDSDYVITSLAPPGRGPGGEVNTDRLGHWHSHTPQCVKLSSSATTDKGAECSLRHQQNNHLCECPSRWTPRAGPGPGRRDRTVTGAVTD